MVNPSSYVNEIQSLKKEMARLNKSLKELRQQRRTAETHLYNYMVRHNMESYGRIKRSSIQPRDKIKRMTPTQRREAGVRFFREIGATDPETIWSEFSATQKSKRQEETTDDYDDYY